MPLPHFLIPQGEIHANGAGPAFELSGHPTIQLTLVIDHSIEQQSLDIHIEGSYDGETWAAKPLAAFPQKFYPGASVILCDLARHPELTHIRATWKAHRWGRGDLTPHFNLYLFAEALDLPATRHSPAASALN